MGYTVLIPARLASARLPGKPLADIGGKPMVVRVAERVASAGADRVVVAADDDRILHACAEHGVQAVLTDVSHPSGSDRLAQACAILGLDGDDLIVNVQGDEPLIDPALVRHCADLLMARNDCVMSTVAHPIRDRADYLNPNVVKVVLDARQRALLFSRAPLPWWRDGPSEGTSNGPSNSQPALPLSPPALRHVGLYGYRAGFLRRFPQLSPAPLELCEALEQLRVLWHGESIAVHVAERGGEAGVDTPADLARVRACFAAATLSA